MPNRKNLIVLAAEDNLVNQKVLGLMLESLGIRYDFVGDGAQAIEAATSFNYGIILMDCMMPNVDGFEASFQIRKFEFEQARHTPIIACTAMDKERILDHCIRSGINDYIMKPLKRDVLKEKIAYWSLIPMALGPLTPADAAHIRHLEASEQAEPVDRAYLNLLYGVQQLDDILDLFMTVTESLISQLESAIERHDVSIVRRMVHEIKSSSYTVSAREMAQVCLQLEQAGELQNWPEIEKLYVTLGLAFARVRECLQNKDKLFSHTSGKQ